MTQKSNHVQLISYFNRSSCQNLRQVLSRRPQLWDVSVAAPKESIVGRAPQNGRAPQIGDQVRIHSLVKAADFNDRVGYVESVDGDRLAVQVEGLEDILRVKPENLEIIGPVANCMGILGFVRGEIVVLEGLQSASEMNGKVGTVQGEDGDRLLVQVRGN